MVIHTERSFKENKKIMEMVLSLLYYLKKILTKFQFYRGETETENMRLMTLPLTYILNTDNV